MVTSLSAVLRKSDGPFSIEEVTLEEPRPDEVLVRVVAAGMCHTDMLARLPALEALLPAALGHEGAGVVEAVGSQVEGLAVGDHVVLSFDSCGHCSPCLTGRPAYCATFELRNMSGRRVDGSTGARLVDGSEVSARWFGQSSFGQYALTTARNTVKVPSDVPLELLGPLGCGIQTGAGAVLNEMKPGPGNNLAVFGAGAVGLAAVMAAKLSGVREIVAVDVHTSRLDLALELGATRVVNGRDEDVLAQVVGDTGGLDFTFDTTGVGSVMQVAVQALARPGLCVLVGAGQDEFSIAPTALIGRHVTFVYEGSAVPQLFIPELVEHYRNGRFPLDRLVQSYQLADIDRAEADSVSGAVVKPVILIPSPEQQETR
ncbi:NAD(P)-dependent alcohol dehydrogenase [Nocardioides insulae]|uniref:NAD(P)-dependent alcohol dehydrogenase n=1 Tax=Nocardioides insulae TaxID=394734 RepID=UPI000414A7B1|nr:NAD(P)-dependent alcohol dehydrogenase [Nocardioides insulae]